MARWWLVNKNRFSQQLVTHSSLTHSPTYQGTLRNTYGVNNGLDWDQTMVVFWIKECFVSTNYFIQVQILTQFANFQIGNFSYYDLRNRRCVISNFKELKLSYSKLQLLAFEPRTERGIARATVYYKSTKSILCEHNYFHQRIPL